MAHLKTHATEHSSGGDDAVSVENLATSETNDYKRLGSDGDGSISFASALKVVKDDTEPTLTADDDSCIWVDNTTPGSEKFYLVYRFSNTKAVKVELT